jgi:hypothetical protein
MEKTMKNKAFKLDAIMKEIEVLLKEAEEVLQEEQTCKNCKYTGTCMFMKDMSDEYRETAILTGFGCNKWVSDGKDRK